MKGLLFVIGTFISGIFAAEFALVPAEFPYKDAIELTLSCMLFMVGVSVTLTTDLKEYLKGSGLRLLALPIAIAIGSLIGGAVAGLVSDNLKMREYLAISAGFGYYSLSSAIIAKLSGDVAGATALVANVARELITISLAPLLVYFFGPSGPIASGGATAMDTTLGVITKNSGSDHVIAAVFSGFILTLIAPLLISFILSF